MMSQQHSSKQIPFNALTSAFVCAILHLMSVTALLYCIYFFYCSLNVQDAFPRNKKI